MGMGELGGVTDKEDNVAKGELEVRRVEQVLGPVRGGPRGGDEPGGDNPVTAAIMRPILWFIAHSPWPSWRSIKIALVCLAVSGAAGSGFCVGFHAGAEEAASMSISQWQWRKETPQWLLELKRWLPPPIEDGTDIGVVRGRTYPNGAVVGSARSAAMEELTLFGTWIGYGNANLDDVDLTEEAALTQFPVNECHFQLTVFRFMDGCAGMSTMTLSSAGLFHTDALILPPGRYRFMVQSDGQWTVFLTKTAREGFLAYRN